MRVLKKHIASWIILFSAFTLPAQDLHFSQFYNSPLTTNPANTGFIPDADYRLGVHYRNQWSSILSQPYRTYSAFADFQVFRDRLDNGWLGLGAVLLGDVAGSGSLTSTKLYLSAAYHQMLGNSSLLSGGFNLGWASKRIDPSGLTFPDQFDGQFFDGTRPTTVVLSNTGVDYLDMQAGVNYAYFPRADIYLNAGYSLHHVNMPRESFFSDKMDNDIIPMRHIGFLNAILKAGPSLILNPGIFFTTQARAYNGVAGLNAMINLSETGDRQLIAGAYYRYGDAVVPMAGFQIRDIRFTFSYDATLSSLRDFNNMNGALELSIIKRGNYPSHPGRQSLCPSF
jgi:type IX secretion system PorP/SprF family membrane protein